MLQKYGSANRRPSNRQHSPAIPLITVKAPVIRLSPEFMKKFSYNYHPDSRMNGSGLFPSLHATSYNDHERSHSEYAGFRLHTGSSTYKGRRVPLKVINKHQGYLSLQGLMQERIKAVSAKRAKKVEEDADKLIKSMMAQVVDVKVDVKSKERLILRLKRMSELRARRIWGRNVPRASKPKSQTRDLTSKRPQKQSEISF